MRIIYTSGTILAIRMGFFHLNAEGIINKELWKLTSRDCAFLHVTCCLQKNFTKQFINYKSRFVWRISYIKKEIWFSFMKILSDKTESFRQNDFWLYQCDFCWDKRFSPKSEKSFLRYLMGCFWFIKIKMWIFKGKWSIKKIIKNQSMRFVFCFFRKNRGSTVRRIVIDMHAFMILICRVLI